jgi:hypothetical protein
MHDALVLNDTTSAHFVYPVNASRYVTRLTSTTPTRPNASNALDSTDSTASLFSVTFPKRDPSHVLSCAHICAPSVARLTAVLIHLTRNLTAIRTLDVAIDSRRVDPDAVSMILPNTANPCAVIVAYAVAVRPSCDALCLALIYSLCDALTIDRPSLDLDCDLPPVNLAN